MKIKCPICKEEIDETHYGTDTGLHLYWKHRPDDDAAQVFRYYAVLIFKIHEKIEETNSYGSETRAMWVRGVLESLLD